ncbi:hypothetical protein PR048_026368 [Dryococelus australis]|uniref:Uncharacterized protein n=1 Tax=Dryococelus australis TaxID=614101 RepID=A0ABQ9GL78_9NEOP|nr:hypothetical protein PR048_026368 [Dryococelus australis]
MRGESFHRVMTLKLESNVKEGAKLLGDKFTVRKLGGGGDLLRDSLLKINPEGWSSQGKECELAFKKDVDVTVKTSVRDYDGEAINLAKAAQTEWKDIFDQCKKGSHPKRLSQEDQIASIPISLLALAVVEHLNPGLIQFLVADSPLYALLKKIQFTMVDTHGEEKLFITMDGLQIKLADIRMADKWLQGICWTPELVDDGVTTQGKADYVLKASHIKRSRYAHEVTAAAIHILQQLVYQDHKEKDTDLI